LFVATAVIGLISPLLVDRFGYRNGSFVVAIFSGIALLIPYYVYPRGRLTAIEQSQQSYQELLQAFW
jgi:hypothetical protein